MNKLRFKDSGFTQSEWKKLSSLKTPEKIQDYINKLPFNFELKGETYMSPRKVLKSEHAHCFEGALLAAAALWIQGGEPVLLDLKSKRQDDDHVVALYKRGKYWGAISKTNHAVLRYREPIYKTIRELALSYFHEYFLPNGKKTMESFSKPFNIKKYGTRWLTAETDLFELVDELDSSPHIKFLPKGIKLRRADKIERNVGEIVDYKK